MDSVLIILSNLVVLRSLKTHSKTSFVSEGDNHSLVAFHIAFSRLVSVTESTSLATLVSISFTSLATFSSYLKGDFESTSLEALSHSDFTISSIVSFKNN
jgi:hypothetical protein